MIRELFMVREKKIIELALIASKTGISKTDVKTMIASEKELFEAVLEKLKVCDEQIITIIEGIKKIEDENLLVKFKTPVSKFVDLKGNELGPFNEKDIANLPKKIAEALINKEIVEIMEI